VDYARGEANLYSDSSSDESSSEEEEGADGATFDKWGELDGDAEQTEEPTRRLAVCNMDWDRVGPEDIFLVGFQQIIEHFQFSFRRVGDEGYGQLIEKIAI
jgi:hypothetical protein